MKLYQYIKHFNL